MTGRVALVLEDRAEDQALARGMFEPAGWEVYIAATVREGMQLISGWLSPADERRAEQVAVLIDLIMDVHGLHLAAIVRDEQLQGRLRPAAVAVLTAGYSAENMHLARLAGCDGIFNKPLTPELVAEIGQLRPNLVLPSFSDEDAWMRSWLINEGQRLLDIKLSRSQLLAQRWSAEEVEIVLKELSGKGWRRGLAGTAELLERLGGHEGARTRLGILAPLLSPPYDQLLRHLLLGHSIEESGRELGYGRSHSYQLFRKLAQQLRVLLLENTQPLSADPS